MIKHCKYYCKSADIKIVFLLFNVGDLFSVKESVPKYLTSFVYVLAVMPVILVKQLAT